VRHQDPEELEQGSQEVVVSPPLEETRQTSVMNDGIIEVPFRALVQSDDFI